MSQNQHRYYRHQAIRDMAPTGLKWVRHTSQVVRFSAVNPDRWWKIGVTDGYRRQVVGVQVPVPGTFDWDITVAGPGGLHPAFVEAVSTVYVLYVAWSSLQSEHNTAVVFGVPSGTAITPALLASLSNVVLYDCCSEPVAAIPNDAGGDLENWWGTDRHAEQMGLDYGSPLLVTGVATVETAIDCSALIPVEATWALLYLSVEHASDPIRTIFFEVNDNGAGLVWYSAQLADGNPNQYNRGQRTELLCPILHDDPSAAFLYLWDGAPSWGLSVYLRAFGL